MRVGRRGWCTLRALAAVCVGAPMVGAQPMPAVIRVVDSLKGAGFTGHVVVADTTQLLFERAIGVARGATWRWASVTKQVAAVLALREVDAGRLALDAPVRRYLPEWPGPASVTIRQLLQHTSGLADPDSGPTDADGVPPFYRRWGGDAMLRPTVNGFCAGVIDTVPGTQFRYNNCDYLVLQAVLERVRGRRFSTLEREVVPMGASLVTPVVNAPPVRGRLADGSWEPRINLATYGAAGAHTGPVRHLVQFDQRLLRGRLLSDSLRTVSWTGNPALGYAALGVWAYPATLRGCPAPIDLVERRGELLGTQVRNILAPSLGRIVIVFTNQAAVSFGEIWQQTGLSYDLLSAALCAGR